MDIVGIDEVGRGALAGPVSVGSFLLFKEKEKIFKEKAHKKGLKFRDSKKLSKLGRESWYTFLKEMVSEGYCRFAVCHTSPKVIDEKGLTKAISSALCRSLKKIEAPESSTKILLDGGLKAPANFVDQKTIIKGDEKELSIMCASIVAKVTRDHLMVVLARKYPIDGLEEHVGYGTKKHKNYLRLHGKTAIHREHFLKKLVVLETIGEI